MNERDDEEKIQENTKGTAFIFKALCNQVDEGLDDLNTSLQQLSRQVNVLTDSLQQIKSDNYTFNAIHKAFLCQLPNEIVGAINDNSKKGHSSHKSGRRKWYLWLGFSFIVGCVSGGLVTNHYETKTINKYQSEISAGQLLMRSWGKLSNKDKQNIIRLGSKQTFS